MRKKIFFGLLLAFFLVPFGVRAEGKTVMSQEELVAALNDNSVMEIILGADIETTGKINVTRDVTIDGANHAITYAGEFFATIDGEGSSDNTIWSKKSTDGTSGAVYVLQAYRCNVTLKDISLANGNRALGINGAVVTLNGVIDVTGNGFQAIELGSGSGVTEVSTLKLDDETIILNGSDEGTSGTLYVDDKAGKIIRIKEGAEAETEYAPGESLSADEININLLYTIDDGENKSVPTSLFDMVKTNNQVLSLARLDDNDNLVYTWEFDGEDIVDTTIEVNTNITFTEEAPNPINADVSQLVVNYQDLSYLNFEHNGKLPGKATISYAVSNKYAVGTKLYVAHFNESTKKLENIQEVTVDEDGSITFEITECSSYVLYTGIAAENEVTATPVVKNAKTGDMNLALIVTFIVVASIGLIATARKIVLKVK